VLFDDVCALFDDVCALFGVCALFDVYALFFAAHGLSGATSRERPCAPWIQGVLHFANPLPRDLIRRPPAREITGWFVCCALFLAPYFILPRGSDEPTFLKSNFCFARAAYLCLYVPKGCPGNVFKVEPFSVSLHKC